MAKRVNYSPGAKRYWTVVFTVITLAILQSPTLFALQAGGDAWLPEAMEADLPAIALTTTDIGIDGMVATESTLMSLERYAEEFADANNEGPAIVAEALSDAGFLAHYTTSSALISVEDEGPYDIEATSSVTQYEDEEGASDGFDLITSTDAWSEVIDEPEVGDQSVLARIEVEESRSDQEHVRVDLAFQKDVYVGVLTMVWYGQSMDEELDADDVTSLAEVMADRMELAADGDLPDLSRHILRLESGRDLEFGSQEERYDVRDEAFVLSVYDNPEVMEGVAQFWRDSNISDVYRTASVFVAPDGSQLVFVSRAYDLGRSRAAREWIGESTTFFIEQDTPGGYEDIGDVEELDGFETDVVGVTYTWNGISDGMRVWFRVDSVVYSLEADGPNGIDEDVFFELIETQISCAEDEGYCEPVRIPEDLFG